MLIGSKNPGRFLSNPARLQTVTYNKNVLYSSASIPSHTEKISSHASHWKNERIYSILTLPLAPAAYFFHGTTMDYILMAVVTLHMH